jgi:diphosphomevalonate decarboxylase
MNKSTVRSPANIAFVKYWGRRNEKLILPQNSSISMNLSNCYTTTTVEFGKVTTDEIQVKFFGKDISSLQGDKRNRVLQHIDRIRKETGKKAAVKIYSENSFPSDAGIASSASAFSALTMALFAALNIKLSEKELTIQTRLSGSGSACRSIPDGFVEWVKGDGNKSDSSYAISLAPPGHWDLWDVVAIVDTSEKKVSSYEGHKQAVLNEYMTARLKNITKRIFEVKKAIKTKDIERLGKVLEEESLSLHTVAMMSDPPIFYLNGKTLEIIQKIRAWRAEGIMSYFTMDAGPNVHVICEGKTVNKLQNRLNTFPGIEKIITNKVAVGANIVEKHLF